MNTQESPWRLSWAKLDRLSTHQEGCGQQIKRLTINGDQYAFLIPSPDRREPFIMVKVFYEGPDDSYEIDRYIPE